MGEGEQEKGEEGRRAKRRGRREEGEEGNRKCPQGSEFSIEVRRTS